MHEYLASFTGAEGVVFIGRAQEKNLDKKMCSRHSTSRAYISFGLNCLLSISLSVFIYLQSCLASNCLQNSMYSTSGIGPSRRMSTS